MNRQPFQTPPQRWLPSLSPFWVRLWRPVRRRRVYREHGLLEIDVRGLHHVREALKNEGGVLITPNHPTHADPYALLEAADQLGHPFYYMAAWQVFAMTHRLGRRVLRQHGCFSVNREGYDLPAFRQALNILGEGTHPLVIFPEGEVFHLNDRVTPFRRGAATAALLAARRSQKPVACIPCALKFEYVSDPVPELLKLMDRLERFLSWEPRTEQPLIKRIFRFAEAILNIKEIEYLGSIRTGTLCSRIRGLLESILERQERLLDMPRRTAIVPERVKHLRQAIVRRLDNPGVDSEERAEFEKHLDDLFFVTQLYSYPVDYLTEAPNIERLAETLDKLEEDILGVDLSEIRGMRRAIVSFGEPILVRPGQHRKGMAEFVTKALENDVQSLLDAVNDQRQPIWQQSPDLIRIETGQNEPWGWERNPGSSALTDAASISTSTAVTTAIAAATTAISESTAVPESTSTPMKDRPMNNHLQSAG